MISIKFKSTRKKEANLTKNFWLKRLEYLENFVVKKFIFYLPRNWDWCVFYRPAYLWGVQ